MVLSEADAEVGARGIESTAGRSEILSWSSVESVSLWVVGRLERSEFVAMPDWWPCSALTVSGLEAMSWLPLSALSMEAASSLPCAADGLWDVPEILASAGRPCLPHAAEDGLQSAAHCDRVLISGILLILNHVPGNALADCSSSPREHISM